jgi:hypothetical protein
VRVSGISDIRAPAEDAFRDEDVKKTAMSLNEKSVYDRYLELRNLSEMLKNKLPLFLFADQ